MLRRFSTTASVFSRAHKSPVATRFPTKYNPGRSAFNQVIYTPAGVVYNPAPSAPSPLETPAAFVPKEDLENRSYVKDAEPYPVDEMPVVGKPPKRTYHLTTEDAREIQRLRHEDPEQWTRKALAQKFEVSEYVIGLVSEPEAQHAAQMQQRLGFIKSLWTDRRKRARDHRERRHKYWIRDA